MKILFIYSDLFPTHLDWPGHYYVGIGYLSSVLKEAGHETALIHVIKEFSSREELLSRIKAYNPSLIGFSSTTLTFKYVSEMAAWIQEAGLGIPVISGGVHTTLFPWEVLKTKGIDLACVGEGEIPLRNLCAALESGADYRNIPGIWVNDNGTVHNNGVGPIVQDLDLLPFPDRSIYDYPNMLSEREGAALVMASRGCPYHCAYCSNRALKKTLFTHNPGDYVRFRSVDHTIAEIKSILDKYPFINALKFDDDLFFLRKQWAEEFAAKYPQEIGLPFVCNMRPNHLSPDIALLLKQAGCVEVKIGLESGNEWIRNEVLKRNLSDKQMIEAFKVCHEVGMRTHSFNIVGVPFETIATVLDTVKMNVAAKSDKSQVSIFYPLPRTELYDLCKEKGFTVENTGYDFFTPMLNIGTISKKRLFFLYKNFDILKALYGKAYALQPSLAKPATAFLDKLFHSPFLDIAGETLMVLRKIKSLLWPRRAINKLRRNRSWGRASSHVLPPTL